MLQRVLPAWSRADHPVMRYVLGVTAPAPRRLQIARLLLVLIGLVALIGGALVVGNSITDNTLLDQPVSKALMAVVFWPTFVAQIGLRAIVLGLTVGSIGAEKRRQTWDSVRTTTDGAALTVRARWSAVIFYRVRILIGVLLAVRLVLIGAILFDLTAFSGDYLQYLSGGVIPNVPLAVAVILLALVMTASLLLPITGLGFDAALGVLLSTFVNKRLYIGLVQILLVALRVGIVAGLVALIDPFIDPINSTIDDGLMWLLLFALAAMGDWGLSLLYLGYLGQQVWPAVPYSLLLGLALLIFVFVQTVLTDVLLALAARRAERNE